MVELSSKFLDREEYDFVKGEIELVDIFRDIKEEVAKKVTEEVTKEVTRKVSEEVTRKVSEETKESERIKTILLMSKTLTHREISNILKLPLVYVIRIVVENTLSSPMSSFEDME